MSEAKATRDTYGEVLVELGRKNEDIVVLDADLSKSTKTDLFAKEFPHRFFEMGIAEQNMIGTAAGFATCGKIPFASTFAVFASGRVLDQVRMSVCYSNLNVKIVATHGGITVGEDGASHQGTEDIAIMRSLPNMVVIVPCDAVETGKVVRAAVKHVGPVYIRLGRMKVPIVMDGNYEFEIGKAVKLKEGGDLTIIATGFMVNQGLEAVKILAAEGLDAGLVNVHTIKPIDVETISQVAQKTGAIVTAEEHNMMGGLGGAVAEVLVERCPVPMKRVAMKDVFGESGAPEDLLVKYGLTAEDIARAGLEVVKRKG